MNWMTPEQKAIDRLDDMVSEVKLLFSREYSTLKRHAKLYDLEGLYSSSESLVAQIRRVADDADQERLDAKKDESGEYLRADLPGE